MIGVKLDLLQSEKNGFRTDIYIYTHRYNCKYFEDLVNHLGIIEIKPTESSGNLMAYMVNTMA